MGTVVEPVNSGAVRFQQLVDITVQFYHVRLAVISPGNPGLVGHHHQLVTGIREHFQGLRNAGQEFEVLRAVEVVNLLVDCPVPVEKYYLVHRCALLL